MYRDFQQYGILTNVDSDEPVHSNIILETSYEYRSVA